jgi:hypothetical protein
MLSSNEKYGHVFIHKNWPFDPRIGYLKHIDVAYAYEAKFDLMAELKVEFKDQVDDQDSLHLHYASWFHLFPMWKWLIHVKC